MAFYKMDIDDENSTSSKGVFFTKKFLILIICIIVAVLLALIFGLVFGLKNKYTKDCNVIQEAQKLEACKETGCKNLTFLQLVNDACYPSTTLKTTSLMTTTSTSGVTTIKPEEIKNYRLPKNLKPYYYDITTITDFNSSTEPEKYDGTVEIHFEVVEITNNIVIHHADLDIDKNSILVKKISGSDVQINVVGTSYDNETSQYNISLANSLEFGQNYSIIIKYVGKLLGNNVGFYKSSYTDAEGKKRWLVASHMEPLRARRAFPCFDEPKMKAKFKMNVVHHKSLIPMFNMPSLKSEPYKDDLLKTEFDETVPMSTYLVALVISDFVCLNETVKGMGENGNVDVRVCGRANAIEQLEYALNVSTKIIKFFEEIYGVKYPLPKCDHIAVPDFNAGAMENWGLVLYRESILFYDPKSSSQSSQQNTVVVIAHELGHMWFGNLVTMEWWNDIWLNEGFATYVEYVGTDHADKSFLMFEQFVERVFDVLQADSVANSRAISTDESEVNKPGEVSAMFDSISYGKGGSVIRMINYAIGQKTFRTGITNYLNRFKFNNAKQDYLWIELDNAAKNDSKLLDLNLTDIMNTWTKQMGHPVITIEKIDNNKINISQKQFLLNPLNPPTTVSAYNYQWFVPFTYSVEKLGSSNSDLANINLENLYDKIQWLKQNEKSKIITLNKTLDNDGFILANLDVSGFYRVNYDLENWNKIIEQINNNHDALPERSRAAIINDAFVLSQAGEIPTTKPFEIIKYLSKEIAYLPWSTTLIRMDYIISMLESTSSFGNFEKYATNLIIPIYNRLGWEVKESDSWLERQLRNRVLSFACAREYSDCVNKAKLWYAQWMQNENENLIPASYRSFVYCTAIRNGGDKEWEFASEQYDKELNAGSRNNLQTGMSCTKQPWLIARYLNDQINGSKVRLQDAANGISAIALRSYANIRTWQFLKDNWDFLFEKIAVGGIITNIASKFNSKSQLDDFKKFFDEHPNQGSAARNVKAAIDTINANIRWMDNSYTVLSVWLNQNTIQPEKIDYRLPKDLVPFHYDISLKVQFDNIVENSFAYDGEVTIRFQCVKETTNLIFHINKLTIDNSSLSVKSLSDNTYGELKGFSWKNDYEREFFVASLSKPFKAGHNYTVTVKFVGYLTDDNAGFYRSSYLDNNNQRRWLLASQMEPTDARKSFPCFDEPALKATFAISVEHRSDYNALSNMRVSAIDIIANNRRTRFETTPKMSTYLVALVVSDFTCINGIAPNAGPSGNLPIRVCARPNVPQEHLRYSLDIGVKIIQFFEKLYGIKYPLPKCDHVAIPDFSAGAMENWGLVTYRESRLIYIPGVTSQSAEQSIAAVIVHEIAHMWFGDIVSPEWWNDLWLNEGFARYMEYIGTENVQPTWEMNEQIVNLMFSIYQLDAVASSHAVSIDVNKPDEINEIFDDITYGKGASVIRMANYFLGNDTFFRGITEYLKKYSYGNAIQDFLWDTLEEVAVKEGKLKGFKLRDIMNTWTRQMGHPVVTIRKVNDRTVNLTQNHFLLDPTTKPESSPFNYKWYVPFTHTIEKLGSINSATFGLSSNTLWQNVTWLLPNETQKIITFTTPLAADNFILANSRVSGFYRVNYDNDNWNNIISQLKNKKDAIPIRNRAQLINDVFSFSQAKLVDPIKPFELIEYLSDESEYLPWNTAINRLRFIVDMLESTSTFGKFQNYLIELITPIYNKLGWEAKPNDSWIQKFLRTNVLSFACQRGAPDCVSKAKSYYSQWIQNENENPIPASLRSLVYCTAIREGGEKEWNFASAQYSKETDANSKNDLQSGMSCTRIGYLINRFLNDQLDTKKVRVQDALSGLRAAATKGEANLATWNFVKNNWSELFKRYGSGLSFARLIADLATKFNTVEQLADYNQFFEKNPNQGSATREVKISRDKINANIIWVNSNNEIIDKWLDDKVPVVEKIDYRLPKDLVPFHYDISLKVQFDNIVDKSFAYDGEVTIHFQCVKETSNLIFHINKLTIDNSSLSVKSLTDNTYGELKGFSWKNDYEREFFVALLSKPFKAGQNYTITVKYVGYLTDDNAGFYRSSYLDNNNQRRWLLASQMEPTDARKSFPCFDEPALKATFAISVEHRSDYNAISNMPVSAVNNLANTKRTKFENTPKMSTYLVGLVVSDFTCISGTAANAGPNGNLPIRICARPNVPQEHLSYAMDVGIKAIEFFEKLYDIKYPLPKCDHLAIPDFSAGAMENWGIITYRESRLIYIPGVTSQGAEQSIATVIAHELAHMWFGDIVSPEWWNDLWLNEGFANFMEHVGTDHVKPDWGMFEILTNSFLSVQQVDSVASSHEIAIDVNNPDEINEIFDDITYSKGGSVIRMANYFIGNDTFNKGITEYLKKYSYGNAIQDNLWSVLDSVAKKENKLINLNLTNIMNTWTRQMGHPVVTIKKVNDRTLNLTQNHFLLDPTAKPPSSSYNYKWFIPYTHSIEKIGSINQNLFSITTNNLWEKVIWFTPNETTKTITLTKSLEADEFILANLDVSGFYRVNYDDDNWNKIVQQLNKNFTAIPSRSRAQLIHDIFSFSQSGIVGTTKPFELIKYMSEETEYLPWNLVISRLNYITNMLESTSAFGNYQNYLIKLITPFYNKIGWTEKESDTWLQKLIRTSVLSYACVRGVPDCINKARSYYSNWMLDENNNQIPASYRSLVYCTAIREGGEKEWNFASSRYSKETDANQKSILQSAMSCTRRAWLLSKFLNDQLDTNKVRPQDALSGLRAAAGRAEGYLKTWYFVKDNWDTLFTKYGNGLSFARLISDITTKFNTQSQLDDFNIFFDAHPNQGSATREVKISRDKIKANINWLNRNLLDLTNWLNENVGNEIVEGILRDVRLPTDLTPSLYELQIKPYIGPSFGNRAFTFDGSIDIHFKCTEPTNQIIFHIKDLDINNNTIKLSSLTDNSLSINLPWSNDYRREFFKANFSRNCVKNADYVLHLDYTGQISKSLVGFYRSSYVEKTTNETVYLATTHFQPTDARRAFPCFDEPAMKAKFSLTIIRHKNFTASFGNMPHESFDQPIAGEPDWRKDKFKESVPMSTYLVAFVVSSFKNVSKISDDENILCEVAARPNAIDAGEGDFALNETSIIIDFFADYFNTSYPLDKSTQIGIPDFNSGAMENWGLVTYRETSLLYNPETDTIGNKRRVSLVVSHELAHQWFGNLVTPDWWNDIWLNEGFASWVEYLGYNKTHPEWRDLDSFFTQKLSVLVKDSLESSHPISVDVDNPDEINSIFDSISYDKGSSIIRMMNSFLTETTFRGGVSKYLDKFKYSNAKQDDLWEYLTKQAYDDKTLDESLNVSLIMDTWTLKKGYPVVTLDRDYNNNKVKITQKWFLLNPEKQSIENTQKWYVPFTHTTQAGSYGDFVFESKPFWLTPENNDIIIDLNANQNEWVVGNIHHTGFYRVNYDQKNWDLLINQLNTNHKRIHEINRATLIDDSFNLGRAEKLNQKTFLEIVNYLQNEEDPIPWTAAFNGMSYIGNMLSSTNSGIFSLHKKFYKKVLQKTYDNYGWDDKLDDATLIDLQLQSMSILCTYDDINCIDKAKSYFKDWKEKDIEIPANFKVVVYNTAIKYGTEDDWYYLYERAKVTTSSTEQVRMFRALATTREYYLLKFLLEQTLNPNVIKQQDETSILSAINSNIAGRDLAWDHFVRNWNGLLDRYGKVSFTLGNLVTSLLSVRNTQADLQKVLDFMQNNPEQGVAAPSFKEAIETININIRWMKTNYESIAQFLAEQ